MMKTVSVLSAILMAFVATHAGAATIAGISDVSLINSGDGVTGTSNFIDKNSTSGTDYISQAELHAALTDVDDLSDATYVLSGMPDAYIDITFSSSTFYNGSGDDLIFFFVGNLDSQGNSLYEFDLSINAQTIHYNTLVTPTVEPVWDGFAWRTLTYAAIDLDDFGLDLSTDPLSDLRLLLGTNNAVAFPALTMAGGFHTSPATVVPLPLPMLLFASGLGLIGLFARRKNS